MKHYSSFILLPSFLSLLQVDAFLLTVVSAFIRPCVTYNSTKILQEYTTILQLKVHNVYVVRKLVGHPPWQKCPTNLALFVFPSLWNGRSPDHQFFLIFSPGSWTS